MFVTYLVVYAALTVVGALELITGWLKTPLGLGVHTFLTLFAIIFAIETFRLIRQLAGTPEAKTKLIYDIHRVSVVLAVLLILFVWILA